MLGIESRTAEKIGRKMMAFFRSLALIFWTAFCCGVGLVVVMIRKSWANWVLLRIGGDLWSRRMMKWTGSRTFVAQGPGVEELPDHGIFIANHSSFLDINALFAFLNRPIVFLAKASLRRVPLLGGVNARVGTVFVKRGNLQDSIRAVEALKKSFRLGRCVVVFPEGTRSKSDEMLPFKKGAFHLAAGADSPIVPVYIEGTRAILPSGRFLSRTRQVEVWVGRAIQPSGTSAEAVERFRLEGERAVRELRDLARASSLP